MASISATLMIAAAAPKKRKRGRRRKDAKRRPVTVTLLSGVKLKRGRKQDWTDRQIALIRKRVLEMQAALATSPGTKVSTRFALRAMIRRDLEELLRDNDWRWRINPLVLAYAREQLRRNQRVRLIDEKVNDLAPKWAALLSGPRAKK